MEKNASIVRKVIVVVLGSCVRSLHNYWVTDVIIDQSWFTNCFLIFLDRIQIRFLDPLLEFFSLGEHRDTVKSFDMKLEDSLASVLH